MRKRLIMTAALLMVLGVMTTTACQGTTVPCPEAAVVNPEAAAAAQALYDATERCFQDLSPEISWEMSDDCSTLGEFSRRYTDAGGFQSGLPAEVEVIGAKARSNAWLAKAVYYNNVLKAHGITSQGPLSVW